MRIHIKSDGTGQGTTITLDSGEKIECATSLSVDLAGHDSPMVARMGFWPASIEACAELRMSEEALTELVEAHGFYLGKFE